MFHIVMPCLCSFIPFKSFSFMIQTLMCFWSKLAHKCQDLQRKPVLSKLFCTSLDTGRHIKTAKCSHIYSFLAKMSPWYFLVPTTEFISTTQLQAPVKSLDATFLKGKTLNFFPPTRGYHPTFASIYPPLCISFEIIS